MIKFDDLPMDLQDAIVNAITHFYARTCYWDDNLMEVIEDVVTDYVSDESWDVYDNLVTFHEHDFNDIISFIQDDIEAYIRNFEYKGHKRILL